MTSSSPAATPEAAVEIKTTDGGEPLTQSWVASAGPGAASSSPKPIPHASSSPALDPAPFSPLAARIAASGAASRLAEASPSRLGMIAITELLENDGLCRTYRAWHDGLKLPVVVQILAEALWEGWPEVKAKLDRDLWVLRTIAHPSIMRVWDFRDEKGLAYLVMDDYDGPSIGDMLELGLRFRTNRALEILDQAIEALWVARAQGVLHLRLEPSHLRLPKIGLARISGLGLSGLAPIRAARISDPGRARDPVCLKTAPYLAPEQAEGAIGDQRSDIYSLGAMIYHALTGEPPFVASTPAAILAKAQCRAPADPARLNREADRDVSDLILRMMDREPDRRFSDYDVLRIALAEVAKRRIASGQTQDITGRSPLWGRVMRIELNLPQDRRGLEKTAP